tara:strand:- start:1399 stop:2298 length:900 start_codon:yes stop_codon:yes gene_type:complete
MVVLLTGAGGFLGQNLISFLKIKGCKIYNLGKTPVSDSTHINLDDLNDKETIKKAVAEIKPDYLFHLAGSSNTSSDIADSFMVNTFFSKFLLEAIEAANLDLHTKTIMMGSAAEYGFIKEDQLPISESTTPKPTTLYGISKLAQTNIALSWQKSKRPLILVRPFNVIGRGMPKHLAVGSFYQQIQLIDGKGVLKTGNLDNERDFIDVSDVIYLMWELINNKESYGKVINLCSGKAVPMIDIVRYMIDISGKDIDLITENSLMRVNDVKFHYGDNSKLLKLVGDFNFTPWKKTINQILET